MAGLVPAIHVWLPSVMAGGWVYFMTNRRDDTLYAGVTSMLPKRAYEHREGLVEGFTKQHDLRHLVYYERHDTIQAAIQREKTIKHWPRAWKVRLIHAMIRIGTICTIR
jgi:putative endonuclease